MLPPGAHRPQAAPGLATAALVCGIVGLLLFFLAAPSIVALVLGLVAWQRARAAPGLGDARGRALAGWILGLIGVVGFVAILISAIATGDLDDDDSLGVGDLRAGQCIDVPQDERISAVPARDCDVPHDAEVYLVRRLDGTSYPGEEAVRQRAARSAPARRSSSTSECRSPTVRWTPATCGRPRTTGAPAITRWCARRSATMAGR